MSEGMEKDEQRLLDLVEEVADKVCGPVLYYDGAELRVHPDLVMELAKPENDELVLILDAMADDLMPRA